MPYESCQRLIFPSVVGALIDKSRGRRLPLDSSRGAGSLTNVSDNLTEGYDVLTYFFFVYMRQG